jgi:hypothetical protein
MNMLEKHEYLSNQRPEVEGMDMTDIHMVEVKGMNMVKERPSKEWPEVEGLSNEWPEVEGTYMVKDITAKVDVEVVKREDNDTVLTKHWIGDRAKRHQRTHQERKPAKLGC